MPYRRLPNTDQARLRAMKTAIERVESNPYEKSPIPFDLLYELREAYNEFRHLVLLYREAFNKQTEVSKQVKEKFKIAKLYVSHFIQSLNMAIQRKELKADVRKYFDLPVDNLSVPRIQTETDLIKWGNKIINGEQERILSGQPPLQCPKLGKLRFFFEDFEQVYNHHKILKKITLERAKAVAEYRPKVDKLIQRLWNAIESYFSQLPPEIMRKKASEYGVVYVFRKNEKQRQTEMLSE